MRPKPTSPPDDMQGTCILSHEYKLKVHKLGACKKEILECGRTILVLHEVASCMCMASGNMTRGLKVESGKECTRLRFLHET